MDRADLDAQQVGALRRALAHPRFELIPIKGMDEHAAHLPRGATVTVTSSPAKGIENTLTATQTLIGQGFVVVPHIAARLVTGPGQLREIVHRTEALGIREIFVIGGDAREPAGPYDSALDLLRGLAAIDHRIERIGIAGYPERHPLVDDGRLTSALRAKRQFASYIVTQICFDPGVLVRWLESIRGGGIDLPVYIGIPGVVDRRRLLSTSLKIGVGDSARFLSRHGDLVGTLLKPGGYDPTGLVVDLAPYLSLPDHGVAGLHLNTFNQVENTEAWRQRLLAALRSSSSTPPSDAGKAVC